MKIFAVLKRPSLNITSHSQDTPLFSRSSLSQGCHDILPALSVTCGLPQLKSCSVLIPACLFGQSLGLLLNQPPLYSTAASDSRLRSYSTVSTALNLNLRPCSVVPSSRFMCSISSCRKPFGSWITFCTYSIICTRAPARNIFADTFSSFRIDIPS